MNIDKSNIKDLRLVYINVLIAQLDGSKIELTKPQDCCYHQFL